MTTLPIIVGYLLAAKALKLRLFNNLGSVICGMISMPAPGTPTKVTGTGDVESTDAATYLARLISVVLPSQFWVTLFRLSFPYGVVFPFLRLHFMKNNVKIICRFM